MPVGFEAFTDDGIFQIDGQTANYQLVQSASQQTVQQSLPTVYNDAGQQFSATFWHASFTFAATAPLYAFTADGNVMVAPWKITNNHNGTFTAEFISASQTTIHLYVWDQVPPAGSTYGLQVFSASGVLIADALSPFTRVIDVVSGAYIGGTGYDNTGTTMPGPGTQAKDYGRPVAIAGCWPAHYVFNTGDGSDGGGETTLLGIGISGSVVTWEFHTFAGARGSHYIGFREASAYRFMVLDMTGIA